MRSSFESTVEQPRPEAPQHASHKFRLAIFLLTLTVLLVGMSCSTVTNLLKTGSTGANPQAGEWSAVFQYTTGGGEDIHWTLDFTVDEGGNQLSNATVLYYYGEMTPDTQATVLLALQPVEIKNGTFAISFSDWRGYSMSTYEFAGQFTSSTQAKGTAKIGDESHGWTAEPATK